METWHATFQDFALTGVGRQALITHPMMAFLASRQCPGTAIRAAMDWALQQASAKRAVVSGFHSPLEQSVLKVLIAASSPVVVVLARPVTGARLPPEWTEPLTQGRMAVVSAATNTERLIGKIAAKRNQWVAELASQIVVAHASPGGQLSEQCNQWQAQNRFVTRLG